MRSSKLRSDWGDYLAFSVRPVAIVTGLACLLGGSAIGADARKPVTLAGMEWPTSVVLTGTGDGRLMTLDPTGFASVWDGQGKLLDTLTIEGATPIQEDGGALLQVAGDLAVLCQTENAPPIACKVIDLRTRRVVARFTDDTYPASVTAVGGGWVVARRRSLQEPSVHRYDQSGRLLGRLPLPQVMIDRARSEGGGSQAACPRVFMVGSEIWAIPSGLYEFFRLAPPMDRGFEVSPCLKVAGNLVPGEFAAERADQLHRCLGIPNPFASFADNTRAAMDAWRREQGQPPLPLKTPVVTGPPSWFAAVHEVAVHGSRVAVLVEPHPEKPEEACRVDLWRFPGPSWTASQTIASPCPRLVGLTRAGAWLRCGERVTLLPLPEATSGSKPCDPRRLSTGHAPARGAEAAL